MKKISTLFFFLFSFCIAPAQSLHLIHDNADVTNGTILIPISPNQSLATELSILNTTDKVIHYQVNRTILNAPMNDSCASLYFCSGTTCYAPNSSVTWTPKTQPITIQPHGTMPDGNGTYGVSAHYDVCPTECNDLIVYYRIYDTEINTADTATITIKYTCSTGINDHFNTPVYLSDAYPNPANSSFSLTYHLNTFSNAQLILNDMVGKKVNEINLTGMQGTLKVQTDQLVAGVYFYSLVMNNHVVLTKKIIINN
ncbi:MAG TPA: T9SS type A sorting domain-containing protein [Bacteroidia bacterium]|nr:T9SS type A sorting domain-containing protein [Bacteroidia bacterium]